ncbi:hypothetical protein B0F90DRAFT_1816997 [Multifurca ochricompacta]|uniref:F-box domain-containing protein n=1 Tax=Multifurca ochricompacta TaxID=376703 RepID=A0AAD4QNU4_9AGAM|nr:hypothetical protein B0F90DRAFT_1816997 [Multifurca ochricompacta]
MTLEVAVGSNNAVLSALIPIPIALPAFSSLWSLQPETMKFPFISKWKRDRSGSPGVLPSNKSLNLNFHNAAGSLPVETLHSIFILCARDSVLDLKFVTQVTQRPAHPPSWVAITYVCKRWRTIALEFKKLWCIITPDLSPKWIAAFLHRSSYTPRCININIGPPSQKPPRRYRLGKRKRPIPRPFTTLSDEMVVEIFSHTSRIENLRLEGKTEDVIRTLTSLDKSIPLASLSLNSWDGFTYPRTEFASADEEERRDTTFTLPESLLGGSVPQLRHLHLRSSSHITFPPWIFEAISEFTVSCCFCAKRLFATLHQMPQLKVLRMMPCQRYRSLSYLEEVAAPLYLKNLSLFVFEDTSLELLIVLLNCLVAPVNVRRHLKLSLSEYGFDDYLWGRLCSSIGDMTKLSPSPPHGLHFRREPSSTRIRIWAGETEPGLAPSLWPPLDNPFSLEIGCNDNSCLYSVHTSYSSSPFHLLQDFCASLCGQTLEELFVEYGTEPDSCCRPAICHRCWCRLFSGFSCLKTLQFGDGAAELLVSASYAAFAVSSPDLTDDADAAHCNSFPDLQRVTIRRGAFSTRVLWDWIHYSFARPAEMDLSDMRENVLALLTEPRWKSADIDFVEDVTESLLIFLLHGRSRGFVLPELSLGECEWDEPDGLEVLRRLLHILDPDWNAILETESLA